MADWSLVPCLVALRDEFNQLAPGRDHASDGSIGDVAHAQSSSDHNPDETGRTPYSDMDTINEVHAIDVDNDLNRSGWSMDRCVEVIVTRHRTGLDDRLQNVIWNRRIWSRSWGWTARAYTGSSPHTEHGHFSARYGSGPAPGNPEADTRPWGLLAADVLPKPVNGVTMLPITGVLPLLKEGMKDPINGWNMVWRLQKLLNITTDGVYGPATATAVAKYNADYLHRKVDGNTVDAATWKRLYGITDH